MKKCIVFDEISLDKGQKKISLVTVVFDQCIISMMLQYLLTNNKDLITKSMKSKLWSK